jgi:hypothetical protein
LAEATAGLVKRAHPAVIVGRVGLGLVAAQIFFLKFGLLNKIFYICQTIKLFVIH